MSIGNTFENAPTVIVPDPAKAKLKAPAIVRPSPGQAPLRCRCGSMDFGAHVRPLAGGGAVVTELVCRACNFVLKLRPADLSLERGGTYTRLDGKR